MREGGAEAAVGREEGVTLGGGEGVRHFLAREIGFGGALPDDPGLRAAIDAGGTVQEAEAGSPLPVAVSAIGERVLAVHSFAGLGSAGPLGSPR